MKVTAILITREKEYPQEVLDSLPEFDEVIIKTECPSILKRYELTQEAKNDTIYVQDDDCTIDVEALFKHYNGSLTHAITKHHKDFYEGTGIALIGYGAFFNKYQVDFSPYIDKYGVDPLLLTQADRVFTFLNQPHNPIVMDINILLTATLGDRMSTSAGHWENLKLIKERLQCIQDNTL